ncbi:MAG TPA: hypothetical protein VN381_06820 [Anaerovoracaceae bacterium]|nr:hypothetical protein [Anaerovoracaceae bacterium]
MSYCIDAGSENCPCFLAVTGDCLVCSRLQGKNFCSCQWSGVCIYNEFVQGNKKVNNPRKDFEAQIVERKFYKDDLVVYVLDVGKGFALKAERPGSYLFVKGSGAGSFYDIPISVMKADPEKGQIHIAVKIISTKTKALLAEPEKLAVRGLYRNGVHGITSIINKRGKNQKTLIIAKGIGIAPGILASQALRLKGSVDMVVDTEKINTALIEDYLVAERLKPTPRISAQSIREPSNRESKKRNEAIQYLSLTEKDAGNRLESLMKQEQYDNVILLVSDYYIDTLGRIIRRALPAADLAVSNNFRLCCGEGLCGSCAVDMNAGETIKMCKCQLKGEELLNSMLYAR